MSHFSLSEWLKQVDQKAAESGRNEVDQKRWETILWSVFLGLFLFSAGAVPGHILAHRADAAGISAAETYLMCMSLGLLCMMAIAGRRRS